MEYTYLRTPQNGRTYHIYDMCSVASKVASTVIHTVPNSHNGNHESDSWDEPS